MISPTGGVTEYNYEDGDIYFNYNDPALLSYVATLPYISFPQIQHWVTTVTGTIDTTQSLLYTITIPGNTAEKKNFKFVMGLDEYFYPEPIPGFPEKPNNLKITLKEEPKSLYLPFLQQVHFLMNMPYITTREPIPSKSPLLVEQRVQEALMRQRFSLKPGLIEMQTHPMI